MFDRAAKIYPLAKLPIIIRARGAVGSRNRGHDLGVCLHFQDDPLLKKVVILKPKWGTDAVYKVLDNRKVIRNHGRFGRDDLAAIWSEPEHQDMLDELLQLMVNFKLCYQIPGEDGYIAPQRLTENQPKYPWDPAGNRWELRRE